MDLQSRKLAFVQQFMQLENEEIVSELEDFLKLELAQYKDSELRPMTIEEFNANLAMAFDDIANNRVITNEELQQKIQQWY